MVNLLAPSVSVSRVKHFFEVSTGGRVLVTDLARIGVGRSPDPRPGDPSRGEKREHPGRVWVDDVRLTATSNVEAFWGFLDSPLIEWVSDERALFHPKQTASQTASGCKRLPYVRPVRCQELVALSRRFSQRFPLGLIFKHFSTGHQLNPGKHIHHMVLSF